jgi:hypothetical protein
MTLHLLHCHLLHWLRQWTVHPTHKQHVDPVLAGPRQGSLTTSCGLLARVSSWMVAESTLQVGILTVRTFKNLLGPSETACCKLIIIAYAVKEEICHLLQQDSSLELVEMSGTQVQPWQYHSLTDPLLCRNQCLEHCEPLLHNRC